MTAGGDYEPRDPAWDSKVQDSFARQTLMQTIGARLMTIAPGRCEIELPYRRDLCQQHGYLHGGIVTAIADTTAGYAAYSLMPPGASVLTAEFKINLLAPAAGELIFALGRVVRAGRTLSVTEAEVFAVAQGEQIQIAKMLATMVCLEGKPDRPAG